MPKANNLAAKLFGDELRKQRESHSLSLRELADRISLTHTALGNFELGKRLPTPSIVKTIANALDIPEQEFLDIYNDAQTRTQLKSNIGLSESSIEEIMRYIRLARNEDRKAKEQKKSVQ